MKNLERLHREESPSSKIQKVQISSKVSHCLRKRVGLENIASMRAAPGVAFVNNNLDCYYTTRETKEMFNKLSTYQLFPKEIGKHPYLKLREIWKDFFLRYSTKSERSLKPIICKNLDMRDRNCSYIIRSFPIM